MSVIRRHAIPPQVAQRAMKGITLGISLRDGVHNEGIRYKQMDRLADDLSVEK